MYVPTVPSRSECPSRWFRIGAGILGRLGALLIFLAAPPATTPAAADCIDYGQYWHDVSRIRTADNAAASTSWPATTPSCWRAVTMGRMSSSTSSTSRIRPILCCWSGFRPKETGVAMAMSGTHVYCLEGYYGLRCMQIIDVSDPLNPVVDATLDTPYGNLEDIAVSGDHAYIAAYPAVIIVDVSNPQEPVVVGSIPVPGVAVGVEVFDHYLCIGARVIYGDDPAVAGLYIADISVPGSPVIVGFVHTDEAGPGDFAITGSHAFLVTPWYGGSSTLHVIDLSDPTDPTIVCSLPVGDNVEDVIVSDTMAYVTQYGGVQAIDISDPRRPRLGAMLLGGRWRFSVWMTTSISAGSRSWTSGIRQTLTPVSRLDLAEVWHAVARGQYAYLTGGYWEGWLKVVDMADPLNPRVVGSTDLDGLSAWPSNRAASM